MSNITGLDTGSECGTHVSRGRRQSLLSITSLEEMYDTIPTQYISTLHGRRESDADEFLSMMQLSAGERNRNMSISSEVHNAELMIR
jgi:hypothetical protein